MREQHDSLISIPQMCELLNRNRRTIWAWVKNGQFPEPVRNNGRTLGWRASTYRQWLAESSAK